MEAAALQLGDGWHQDVRYWSFERPELVSVWLALGHEHPDNGCLSLIPRTHLLEVLRERLDGSLFLREDLGAEPRPDRYPRYAPARAGRHVVLSLPHLPRGRREPYAGNKVLAGDDLSHGGQLPASWHAVGVAALDCGL